MLSLGKTTSKLLRIWVKPELLEEIEGNLLEYREQQTGSRFEKLKYWREVLSYLRLSTMKKGKKNSDQFGLIRFNPLLTLRILSRYGSSVLINIAGFTIGLICVFFLFFYIQNEMSVDQFHSDKDQIYRAIRTGEMNGEFYDIGVTSGPFAPALETDYEGIIESTCRVLDNGGLISIGDKKFGEDRVLFVDPNFFQFFSFKLVSGQVESVLEGPGNVLLSESTAEKYFPGEDPIGKTIIMDMENSFMVTGIFQDTEKQKSHLEADLVGSLDFYKSASWFDGWWNNSMLTYVKIENSLEAESLNLRLQEFMDKYFGDNFSSSGFSMGLKLEPLEKIYFNNETRYDFARHGDLRTLTILGMVGIAILIIAAFNYVNLAIAFSFKRAKEVGVRKVLGVNQSRLMLQFLGESAIILLFSMILAAIIGQIILPYLNTLFGLQVSFYWLKPTILLSIGSLFFILLIFSGLYPSFLMSSFKPLEVLNGRNRSVGNGFSLRKALVILQFTISIFMIAATLFISSQLKYVRNKDLGFEKEAVMVVRINNDDIRDSKQAFENELLQNVNVHSISSMTGVPGGFYDASIIEVPGIEGTVRIRTLFTDHRYFETLGISIVAGSGFSHDMINREEPPMILNEAALDVMGYRPEDVLNKTINMPSWNARGPVIGIVQDYNFISLKEKIEPMVIVMSNRHHRQFAISLNASNIVEAVGHVESIWERHSPEFPMQYEFLDDSLDKLYENEIKQSTVFTAFSGVSIFLACLGILGLVSYSAKSRQKELGIRKILGASVPHIIGLIGRQYLVAIVVAMLIAVPFCWYFVRSWLESFAYRIDILEQWPLFIMGGLLTMLVAGITILIRTYGSAIAKPTESIRYE